MNPEDQKTERQVLSVEDLVAAALQLPPEERAPFLDEQCADDLELRQAVESRLVADPQRVTEPLPAPPQTPLDAPPPRRRTPRAPTNDPDASHLETIVQSYCITELIASGGMGLVYRAKHVALDKFAVVKMLRAELADTAEHIERFMNEAKTLAKIRHPGIVDIYDVGVHADGNVFIILELLDGEPMDRLLRRVRRLHARTAMLFTQQASRALAAVHDRGIIHRDLKPDNLFIVPDPEVRGGQRVKVLDFGISKLGVSKEQRSRERGFIMGTPAYMAPEQCRGAADIDLRADLYSLGIILFQMLTGRLPFIKEDKVGYLLAHTKEKPPRVDAMMPEIDRSLADLVARLLAKRPGDRFQSARELNTALDHILGQDKIGDTDINIELDPAITEHQLALAMTEPPEQRAHLWRVPELPPHFLPRTEDSQRLIDALCADSDAPVGIASLQKHGVHGMGGIGKSVLAAAVARSEEVRARFTDGIYWVTVGQTPQLTALQSDLARELGIGDLIRSPTDGKHKLTEHLAGRHVLLVLDDVWQAEHASWLEVVGDGGRMLITTRNLDVLTWRDATAHSIDVLSDDQARALLAEWTATAVAELPPEADEVAESCGRLPLALAIAGALVRKPGGSWTRVLKLLRAAKLKKLRGLVPSYPYRNVYQVIEASVTELATQLARDDIVDQPEQCYADLAVFAEDEDIPRDALRVLWGRYDLDDDDVDELAGALVTHALASMTGDGTRWHLRLHDIQRAYVRSCTPDLAALHRALVDAYAQRCPDGLARGPEPGTTEDAGRAYYFHRLPYHLMEAGREAELRQLLGSYAWLASKLGASGVVKLIADYDRIDNLDTQDRDLAAVRDALRLSSHVLVKDADQLPTQLIGRLGHFTKPKDARAPTLRSLLDEARALPEHSWLCPIRPSLSPPGGPLMRTFEGPDAWVLGVALTADGTRALSGSSDHMMRLWDTESGQLLRTFEGHTDMLRSVALTADGKRALSGSDDCTLKFWDASSGELLNTMADHTAPVRAVWLSADGHRALSGSEDCTLKLWDTAQGRLLRTFVGHTDAVRAVACSADGSRVLSGSDDRCMKLWDADTGQELRMFEGHSALYGGVNAAALSADGSRALSGSEDRTLKLWDTDTGELVRTFVGHWAPVYAVVLSADGARALSGSEDRTVKLWDTRTGQCMRTFVGHSSRVRSVAFNGDGTRALSGAYDGKMKLWDTEAEQLVRTFVGHWSSVNAVALSADGEHALSGSEDRTVKLWDTHLGKLVRTFVGHSSSVLAVALSVDGTHALSGSYDRTVKLWATAQGKLVRTFEGHASSVYAVALSADGTRALSGSHDRIIKLWDTRSGKLVRSLVGHQSRVWAVVLSADDRYALSGSDDRTVKLWDVETGELVRTFEGHTSAVLAVALSADGTLALSGSDDSSVKLWDVATGKELRTFNGHADSVLSVTLSQDGTRAVSGSEDGTARLWHVPSGEIIATFITDSAIPTCALTGTKPHTLILGDRAGRVHFLRLMEPSSASS